MAMAARPQTPVQDVYSIPRSNDPGGLSRGYGTLRSSSRPSSYAGTGSAFHYNAQDPSLPHNPRFREEFDAASHRSSVALDGPVSGLQRSVSQMSHTRSPTPSRSGTLRKKASLSKKGSLRRNGSRKSLRAGSVKSLNLGDREKYADGTEDPNSAFLVPIPTTGNPTEVLANRFQGMFQGHRISEIGKYFQLPLSFWFPILFCMIDTNYFRSLAEDPKGLDRLL